MSVNNILDEIENLVVEGKRIPLTNKSLIDEMELVHLVDNLRQELPLEIQNAQNIMDNKDSILNEARGEADQILGNAKERAEQMIEESKIVRESKEKAALVMEQAAAQQKEIVEQAYRQAHQLRSDASAYANQVFDHLIVNVGNALSVLNQAREELQKMPVEPDYPLAQEQEQEPQPLAPVNLPEDE